MTNQQHSITPPPEELRRQWQSECPYFIISVQREDWMIGRAAQWGADQELEACCEHIANKGKWFADPHFRLKELREARRPKPPSLKKQALEQLGCIQTDLNKFGMGISTDTIRRALETLPND